MIYKSLLKKVPLAPATGGNKSVKVVFATKNIAWFFTIYWYC